MNVGELREAMEGLDDTAPVFIVEYGYRSRNMMETERAEQFTDLRTHDDWGNPKDEEAQGPGLYIESGGNGANRYPPSGLFGDGDPDDDLGDE